MKKPLFNGNKKKLIIAIAAASAAIVLAVVLVLVLLLGGGKKKDYNVNGAADLLDATYIDQIEDGRVDYELLNSIAFQGNTYSIKWSVDVTEGVKLVVNGDVTKVDVDEASENDVDYTLTATVSDPNGNTATVKFYATLLKAKALIPVEITASPEEGTAYRLYVYQNDAKKDCYFNGNIAATYYLGSVEDYESAEAVKVYVEYKEGSTTEFYMYFEHVLDGKQYINVVEKWHKKNSVWTYNPEISGTPSNTYTYSTEYNTIISEVPARSVAEENYDAPQDTTQTIYFGNSGGTYTTIGSVEIEEFGKEGFVANLVTMESAKDKKPEEKVAFEKDSLLVKESFVGDQVVELSTYGKRYPDVKIDWTVVSGGELVSYADGKLTITAPTAETTATLKATISLGEKTETKEFTIILLNDTAKECTIPQALEAVDGTVVTVTGTVKSIKEAWNEQYENNSVYITDADGNELYVYRLKTKVDVGDEIKVTGSMATYSGNRQIGSGATAEILKEGQPPKECTISQALLEADNTYVVVAGTVKSIDEAWSTQYNNMCVTITDDTGAELYIYRLATQVNEGDEIKVTGTMATYKDARQIAQGATAEITKKAATPTECTITEALAAADDTYVAVTGTVKSVDYAWSDQYKNMSITITDDSNATLYIYKLATKVSEGDKVKVTGYMDTYNSERQIKAGATAEILPAEGGSTTTEYTIPQINNLADGTAVIVKGTVVEIREAWSSYNNMSVWIADEDGNRLQVYRMTTKVGLYDEITVTGTVSSYSEVKQIAQGATAEITKAHVCSTYTEASCTAAAKCTVCGVANGSPLEHYDGDDADTICDTCTLDLAIQTQTETFAIAANAGTLNDKTITWSSENFTFSAQQGSNNNAIRTSDTDHFRIYKGNIFTVAAKGTQKLMKIVVTCTSADYAAVLVESLASVSGVTATANGAVVTITFTGDATSLTFTTTAQVRVNNFEVTYA